MKLKYSKLGSYKYKVEEEFYYIVPIYLPAPIEHSYFRLDIDGWLTIRKGYCWDGPSGPTIDTPDFMRGSLVHDVLYQMFRLKLLDHKKYRKMADEVLRDICLFDGMPRWRAWYVYTAVRLFAEKNATRTDDYKLYEAP